MSSRFSRAWRNGLWRLALASVVATAIGWWFHAIAACLLVVAFVWLALGIYRLRAFARWIESGRRSHMDTSTSLRLERNYATIIEF